MKSSFAFLLDSVLLFEACLLQLAHYTAAATAYGNATGTCGGCSISAAPTTLTYPSAVSEVTSSVSVTVIPYITQYDNGTEVTSYSTYAKYSPSASKQTAFTNPVAPLTWKTLGTTLTYPTTYLAFISPAAGVSKTITGKNPTCSASLKLASLKGSDITHLIFPSTTPADRNKITASVASILDGLATISAAVSPFKPADCSHSIGITTSVFFTETSANSATAPEATPPAPVTHTSVKLLTTQGQAVITRVMAEKQTTPAGGAGGAGGKSVAPGQGGNNGGTPTVGPVLNIGGSTITAGPSGVFNVGGNTLTPGGTAVVGGTTISLAPGGSVAVLNSQTSTLAIATGNIGGAIASGVGYTGAVATGGAAKAWISGFAVGALGLFVGVFL